jgi:hypothetical protein
MTSPVPSDIRFRVDPGDVPPEKAARRLHLTFERFNEVLPRLLARGFPPPDPDTGCFALEAIDQWRKLRTPSLFGLTAGACVAQAEAPQGATASMGDRFIEAKERRRNRGPT